MYDKPHLTYAQQVDLLVSRGLQCSDRAAAESLLRAVGYYRLSAYVYPFREMLPEAERGKASPTHYRGDAIMPGTSFKDVEALWDFDRKLRLKLLDGLELLEVGLRTQIAHIAGRRNTYAHLDRNHLEASACDNKRFDPSGLSRDDFTRWLTRHGELCGDAAKEDYIQHHEAKYGPPVPIWIAVEYMDFGALVALFGLLKKQDQNEIAREFGVRGGPLLLAWLRSLNYSRNVCAHHSRLWNRTLTLKLRVPNPTQVDDDLHHLAAVQQDKVYWVLAIVGYLVKRMHTGTRWHLTMADVIKKFPSLSGVSPEATMGFPEGWQHMQAWKSQ